MIWNETMRHWTLLAGSQNQKSQLKLYQPYSGLFFRLSIPRIQGDLTALKSIVIYLFQNRNSDPIRTCLAIRAASAPNTATPQLVAGSGSPTD